MPKGRPTILWFNEVTKKDIALVGGKGTVRVVDNILEVFNSGRIL